MLIINEDLLEIDSLIDELVDELENQPQIHQYQKFKNELEADQELQEKIQKLSENQEYLDFRPELRELQKEILLDEKVYALRIAENDVQELLSSLTKKITSAISESIFVDENLPLKGGSRHERHH